MHHVKCRCVGYLVFIGMLMTASPLFAAAAATVEFVWGTAYAVSISGDKRELEKGSGIDVGDTVVSETARVQLRFTDGGFVSLLPHSEFRVNAYSYSGKPDGSERIAMELIRGGLRTISGLIGKAIQSAYEMKTNVATIGIRGTEYTVVYGESVSGTVSAGAVAVCNVGGCLDVSHGQSYYVKDENTKPVFISKPAVLSPPQPVITAERIKDDGAEDKNSDAKSSDKRETRSGRRIQLSSRNGYSPQEKVDESIGGDHDVVSFSGEQDSGQREKKSWWITRADNSQQRIDAMLQPMQSDKTFTALPLAEVGSVLDDTILGGPVFGKRNHSPK